MSRLGQLFPYNKFVGLDTFTDKANMSERFFRTLKNAFVDFRGQINKEGGWDSNYSVTDLTHFVRHFGASDIVYAIKNASNTDLKSTTGFSSLSAFTGETADIDATQFDNTLFFSVFDQAANSYDGAAFAAAAALPEGGANATILKRLAVSNIPSALTEIQLSVLNDPTDFTTTGTAADALTIDIKNQLSTKDTIQGLGVLEGDKLVIFCQNETLLYSASEDATEYTLLRDFRVPIGLFGKRTIVPVGNDLFFCSKFGLHSIRRALSGLTLETIQFSKIVESTYLALVADRSGTRDFRAAWNANLGQFSIFAPLTNGLARLMFSYEPGIGRGGFQSWSFDEDSDVYDASFFAGGYVAGVVTGLVDGAISGEAVDMEVRTPILWQGAPHRVKHYRRIFIRNEGSAAYTLNLYDEEDNLLETVSVPAPSAQTETPYPITCYHRAKGIQLEFLCSVSGTLKILDFAIQVEAI